MKSGFIVPLILASLLAGCASAEHQEYLAENRNKKDLALSEGVRALVQEEGELNVKDDERVVCKRRRKTGTRLGEMYCETMWERKQAQDAAQSFYSSSRTGAGGGGN